MTTRKTITVTCGEFTCHLEGYENPQDIIPTVAAAFRDFLSSNLHVTGEDQSETGDMPLSSTAPTQQTARPEGTKEEGSAIPTPPFDQQDLAHKLQQIRESISDDADPPDDAADPAPSTAGTQSNRVHDVEVAENHPSQKLDTSIEDSALERLMAITSSHMADDQSSRRRTSIAHIKAAVAATRNDKNLNSETVRRRTEDLQEYRDDLEAAIVIPSPDRPFLLADTQRVDDSSPRCTAASAGRKSDYTDRRGKARVAILRRRKIDRP